MRPQLHSILHEYSVKSNLKNHCKDRYVTIEIANSNFCIAMENDCIISDAPGASSGASNRLRIQCERLRLNDCHK